MKRIIILLPVYNDWRSLQLLLRKIDIHLRQSKFFIEIFIINDCSTEKNFVRFNNLKNINKIKIINLKKNVGSQKAIFIGLNKINQIKNKSTIVIMDSDGEDDPSKIKILVREAVKKDTSIIFAKRKKRLEALIFRLLNQLRLIITFLLIGKYLNFGNFCSFSNKNLKTIIRNKNTSIAFCSGVVKNHGKINFISVPKKKRFFGHSKVNGLFLVKHSMNIISIFYKQVFIRTSIALFFILNFNFFNSKFFFITAFFSVNFLFFLFYIFQSFRENPNMFISKVTKVK